jgi:hypothetical protein
MLSTFTPTPAYDGSDVIALSTAAPPPQRQSGRRAGRSALHRTPCRVHWTDAQTGHSESLIGDAVNVWPDGLSIQVGRPVRRGLRVEILLGLATGNPVCVAGVIVGVRRIMTGTYEVSVEIGEAATPT